MKCFENVFVLLSLALVCCAREFYDKLDRYIIGCHSTDFTCFKKQYQSLRDNVLLGNDFLDVAEYEPYYFRYGDSGTCIKLSGMEESRLAAVGFDSVAKKYLLVLELPLKIQQIINETTPCSSPAHEFHDIPKHTGPLKRFSGNATIEIIFPYELMKKKRNTHMILGEEELDIILDIPDLSDYRYGTDDERQEFELSEWAFDLVRHIDAGEDFALPYTGRFRNFTERVPLEKYLLLYPEEEYTEIRFAYNESPFFDSII